MAGDIKSLTGTILFSRAQEIWMLDLDGSDVVQVTCNPRNDQHGVWSPNGETILVHEQFSGPPPGQNLFVIRTEDVVLHGCQSGRFLFTGRWASWSRDGRVAFDRGSAGRRDVWTLERGCTEEGAVCAPVNLTFVDVPLDPTRDTRADWSPDGRQIAFAVGEAAFENNEDIFVMDADGSNVTQLTSDPPGTLYGDNGPQFSPRGQIIAFQSDRPLPDGTRRDQLYLMDTDGSNVRRITDPTVFNTAAFPRWSPDGRHIVFQGQLPGQITQLWIMNADGSDPRQITTGSPQAVFPDWTAHHPLEE